jgi:hypothetical protein
MARSALSLSLSLFHPASAAPRARPRPCRPFVRARSSQPPTAIRTGGCGWSRRYGTWGTRPGALRMRRTSGGRSRRPAPCAPPSTLGTPPRALPPPAQQGTRTCGCALKHRHRHACGHPPGPCALGREQDTCTESARTRKQRASTDGRKGGRGRGAAHRELRGAHSPQCALQPSRQRPQLFLAQPGQRLKDKQGHGRRATTCGCWRALARQL